MNFSYLNNQTPVSLTDVIESIQSQSLIAITGITMSGKTQLALKIAEEISRYREVQYISLDETKEILREKFISMVTGIPRKKLNGVLSNEELENIKQTLNNYRENKILITEAVSLTLDELESFSIKAKLKNKELKLIIIDKCNLLKIIGTKSFQERMTILLDRLKHIILTTNTSILITFSTRRSTHNASYDDDLLTLIKNADVVFNTVNADGAFEVTVDKNNFGLTGFVK